MPSWAPKLLLFLLTLVVAIWQQWQPDDLAWSMWSASLFGGYLYIVYGLLRELKLRGRWQHFLFALPFFTVHFLGFHFGHSQFMQSFFPLAQAPMGFLQLVLVCLQNYWVFVLLALINLVFDMRANDKPASADFSPLAPYKAVMRNHLMIFVVAFTASLNAQFWLLVMLILLYFFPFELLSRRGSSTA